MAASSSSVRSWRTAFLTLRDETLTNPPRATVVSLLHHLILSQSETLVAASPYLPPHEVTSDVMFLMELTRNTFDAKGNDDLTDTFTHLSPLIHDVSHRVSLEINPTSWALVLDSFGRMLDILFSKAGTKRTFLGNVGVIRAINQCLETIKCLLSVYQRKCSLSENTQLLNFLLSIVASSHAELFCLFYSSGNQRCAAEFGKRIPRCNSLWEVQTVAFTMIGEVFSRVGSSFPVDIWQSTIEVLKKVMDALASKSLLVEDNVMARFYTSLLHCLHLVLIDPKGSLSDHVAGFVAALRMFFIYGLTKISQLVCPRTGHNQELSSPSLKLNLVESNKTDCGPYRPPHLRKKDQANLQQPKAWKSLSFSDHESTVDYTSSDSDYSDSDGSAKDTDNVRSSKARVAAIVCIQDLCRADPKSFTAQWTMLLPSSDVLQPRKYEGTLMTCLLFDPYLKARIASASTLATMLDGPASVFLQVAEYKESSKCGSFTALSSSLGQILMQLHTGILYFLLHETHSGLLAASFKILMLLISSTPYSRMPGELLPTVISSLLARIEEGFPFRSDQTGLLVSVVQILYVELSMMRDGNSRAT
uniref:Putative HEAT repeat-containing protein 6 n=1 Tax=Davidia involucrata TaxID=16924 RepID=A0A5B7A0N8_DAVIN